MGWATQKLEVVIKVGQCCRIEEEFYAFMSSYFAGKSIDWLFDCLHSKHITNKSHWFVEFVEDITKELWFLGIGGELCK